MCPKRRQQCKVIMHVVDKGIAGLNNTHKKTAYLWLHNITGGQSIIRSQ